MTDVETRCLDAFPEWLRTLPADVRVVAARLDDESLSETSRRHLAGAVNYVFRSLDLIPDGIDELGYVDDAFVLRVASELAARSASLSADDPLAALASDGALVQAFLGSDFERLEGYVADLTHSTARGRTAEDIVCDPEARTALVGDVDGWAADYAVPSFSREGKTLAMVRSFLSAKLPETASAE